MNMSDIFREKHTLTHFSKILKYPCGICDIVSSSAPDFREPGFVAADDKPMKERRPGGSCEDSGARSMRRARANVRRIALSNDFRWFVTLTLSPDRINRYDMPEIVRHLNAWASNAVQRHGLKYILVPERHKDGAIHFHGFFNDSLQAVPSGHYDGAGHMIYNFPQWSLGFTAGIACYGEYPRAVAYVCKYIGKQGEKPAGRWYYSGGNLNKPEVILTDISNADLKEQFPGAYSISVPGREIVVVNGLEGYL